jgi:hypothetical protein
VRIEHDAGLLRIQDLEDLLLIRNSVGLYFFDRERRPRRIPTRRVADQSREVSDQEQHVVAEFLKAAHLVDEHRVAEMQIRSGRIEACFHAQRLTAPQLRQQLRFQQDFGRASLQLGQLLFSSQHRFPLPIKRSTLRRSPAHLQIAADRVTNVSNRGLT